MDHSGKTGRGNGSSPPKNSPQGMRVPVTGKTVKAGGNRQQMPMWESLSQTPTGTRPTTEGMRTGIMGKAPGMPMFHTQAGNVNPPNRQQGEVKIEVSPFSLPLYDRTMEQRHEVAASIANQFMSHGARPKSEMETEQSSSSFAREMGTKQSSGRQLSVPSPQSFAGSRSDSMTNRSSQAMLMNSRSPTEQITMVQHHSRTPDIPQGIRSADSIMTHVHPASTMPHEFSNPGMQAHNMAQRKHPAMPTGQMPMNVQSMRNPPRPGSGRGGPPPATAVQAPQKELKVEDALLYLDQVKMEFGDRPRIYNEFLEIMKNFKSAHIDTPGVIARVSQLFRGYNKLILGFNTFLPEGYKIELKDLEEQDAARAREEAALAESQRLAAAMGNQATPGRPMVIGQPGPAQQGRFLSGNPIQMQDRQQLQPPPQQQPSIQKIPSQHGSPQPRIVTQSTNVAPPQPLVLSSIRQAPTHVQQPQVRHPQTSAQGPPAPQNNRFQPIPQPSQVMSSAVRTAPSPRMAPTAPPAGAVPQQQQQPGYAPVEFDHAITYVTTIKKRFSNQPEIYQQFLEILHTYQREQRGINDVLEKVTNLFANHPDLLREFIYFLPDAVQEHAKSELNRAAARSEERLLMMERARHREAAAANQAAAAAQVPVRPEIEEPLEQLPPPPIQQPQPQPQPPQTPSLPTLQPPPPHMFHEEPPTLSQIRRSPMEMIPQKKLQPLPPISHVPVVKPRFTPRSTEQPIAAVPTPSAADVPSVKTISRPVPQHVPRPQAALHVSSVLLIHPPVPVTFTYNSAIQRQFFDAVKEALSGASRDGDTAWSEFLKLMDLYAQEALNRQEMLGYVKDILGEPHEELFNEFKKMLHTIGSPSANFDMTRDEQWHTVPLSEIDFTRCRKCTPSYRALPPDYPTPPCSERSLLEASILNDHWVSLPVGSEESYTFRHMRRNQHEESLFRVEDERFEIDMAIDTNATTLRRLEPIAEEISLLSRKELLTSALHDIDGKGSKNKSHVVKETSGAGGQRFQLVLDKDTFTIIHIYSITRVYGEYGQTMMKLLYKNPAKAVPIVLKRLRQKDREWRAARDSLQMRWKEVAELNYHKSLDHRSLTWRTIDKRATSTRTLLAEVKDRAANNGRESEAALLLKREKAKEEYGSYYEITMGRTLRSRVDPFEQQDLPRPTDSVFTPHLSLVYENMSWAQCDAYRVIAFALERGSHISPADKERGNRLLRDFIGPLFGLSPSWMFRPALRPIYSSITQVENVRASCEYQGDGILSSEQNSMEVDVVPETPVEVKRKIVDNGTFSLLENQPVPDGTPVATIFGDGVIAGYNSSKNLYGVDLPYGQGVLQPDAILCSLLPTSKSSLTDELWWADDEALPEGDMLVFGTQPLYLFFRLHEVLCRRLNTAKRLALEVSKRGHSFSPVESISGSHEDPELVGRNRYEAYMSLLYSLLEGSTSVAEGGRYEDRVRSLLGHYAYELATMDKLVNHIVKHLQNMGSDDVLHNMIRLYKRHLEAGAFKPTAMRQEAAHLSEGENVYAFQLRCVPKSDCSIMHYEYLGCIAESDEDEEEIEESDKRSRNGDEGSLTPKRLKK